MPDSGINSGCHAHATEGASYVILAWGVLSIERRSASKAFCDSHASVGAYLLINSSKTKKILAEVDGLPDDHRIDEALEALRSE